MGGVFHVRRIKIQSDILLAQDAHGSVFIVGGRIGKYFDQRIDIAGARYVDFHLSRFLNHELLQRRVYGVGVITVTHDGLAQSDGAFDLGHGRVSWRRYSVPRPILPRDGYGGGNPQKKITPRVTGDALKVKAPALSTRR